MPPPSYNYPPAIGKFIVFQLMLIFVHGFGYKFTIQNRAFTDLRFFGKANFIVVHVSLVNVPSTTIDLFHRE